MGTRKPTSTVIPAPSAAPIPVKQEEESVITKTQWLHTLSSINMFRHTTAVDENVDIDNCDPFADVQQIPNDQPHDETMSCNNPSIADNDSAYSPPDEGIPDNDDTQIASTESTKAPQLVTPASVTAPVKGLTPSQNISQPLSQQIPNGPLKKPTKEELDFLADSKLMESLPPFDPNAPAASVQPKSFINSPDMKWLPLIDTMSRPGRCNMLNFSLSSC